MEKDAADHLKTKRETLPLAQTSACGKQSK